MQSICITHDVTRASASTATSLPLHWMSKRNGFLAGIPTVPTAGKSWGCLLYTGQLRWPWRRNGIFRLKGGAGMGDAVPYFPRWKMMNQFTLCAVVVQNLHQLRIGCRRSSRWCPEQHQESLGGPRRCFCGSSRDPTAVAAVLTGAHSVSQCAMRHGPLREPWHGVAFTHSD